MVRNEEGGIGLIPTMNQLIKGNSIIMKYIWKSYISVLLIISLTITALSNVASAANNSTREVKAANESSVEKSVYSINASISPEITAKLKELKKSVKREATEYRTENSRHYELSDGSFIAEVSGGLPYYEDESGTWHEANTVLTDELDLDEGKLIKSISKEAAGVIGGKERNASEKNSSYVPLHVAYEALIPKDYSQGYQVGKRDSILKIVPVDADSVIGSVYGNGDTIKYENVWENTDVSLRILDDAVKEDIILKNEQSPSVFYFELQGSSIDRQTFSNNDLYIQPAWLIDSKGTYKDVGQEIEQVGKKQILKLTIDKSDLSYPITIDPSVSVYNDMINGITSTLRDDLVNTASYNSDIIVGKYNTQNRGLTTEAGYFNFRLYSLPAAASKIQYAYLQTKFTNYLGAQQMGTQQVVDTQYQFDVFNPPVNSVSTTVSAPGPFGSLNNANIDFTNAIKAWFASSIFSNYDPTERHSITLFLSTNSMNTRFDYYINDAFYTSFVIGYNVYAPGTAAITAPQNGTIVDSNYNITWNAAIDQDDPQSSLKYNIQLSTNGGATWSDIVPLTAAGASSYTYNFSSIANTMNAIIRIRSFDGIDYGSWVQSPTFTIKHNTVPNAPTALNPGSTSSTTPQLMGTTTPALNWTFSDPDAGDTQGQYQVYIYNGTTLIRDSGWVSSSAASYTVPTGTLSRNGTYNWQVRTKDNKGAISAVSAKYYIKVNNLPTVSVTSYTNGQQVTDNVLTFTWTYSDADGQAQSHYQIQGSQDNWTTVAYNSGALSGNATSFTTPPLASGTWSFRITAKDGLEWSAAATRSLVLPNAYEPNDTTAQAYPINYAQNYTSLITTATDIDFYKYTATAAGIEKFKLTVPTGLNYDVYVYDASMNLIAAGIRGTGLAEEIIYNVNAGATYYIKIVGVGGSYSATTSYGFSLTRQAAQYTTTYQYDFNGNITGKTVTITN